MSAAVPRVHAVTNADVAALPNLEALAAALAVDPAVALHARIPGADGRRIFELTTLFLKFRSTTLVNDRVDVAMFSGAHGAHLPADGLPVSAARELVRDKLLGRSVHSADEARRAADAGVDYVFLGPIWETSSHPGHAALGLDALRGLGSLKAIAIGGITPARAARCRDAGAWGVAAISALWHAPDPAAAVHGMLLSFER